MSEPIDIGHGVTIYFTEDNGGTTVGLIEEHLDPKGEKCSGYVRFRTTTNTADGGSSWIVESREPLTLSPSVLCTTCKHHGWIKDGRWVPA